jgi:hypothetical protein
VTTPKAGALSPPARRRNSPSRLPIHPTSWKGNSAKFGCGKQFSEASTHGRRALGGGSFASQAPYLLHDCRGGRYLVEHSIGSSLQDLIEVRRP